MIINGIERDYVVHNENEIRGFFAEYRYMSNFHKCPVMFDGKLYPSSENAYMAAKSKDPHVRSLFDNIDPKDAKALGRTIELRPDWEGIKYDIMLAILFDKLLLMFSVLSIFEK
jgi:predicted NAD-dependent protein-ADP-ribosyltransferase YbiA (DUF1768 family)